MLHFKMLLYFFLICYFRFHIFLTRLRWRRSCLCFHIEALAEPRLWVSESPWCTGAGTRTETVRDREKCKTLEEGEKCLPHRDTHLLVLISKWLYYCPYTKVYQSFFKWPSKLNKKKHALRTFVNKSLVSQTRLRFSQD